MAKDNVARRILYPNDANILVRVAFLYVGQGASAIVFMADGKGYKVLLVDINLDRKNGGIDVPSLMTDLMNGEAMDAYVNTHPHDDHLCGLQELSDAVDITNVWHSNHKPSKKHGEKHPELTALIKKVKEAGGEEIIIEAADAPVDHGDAKYHFLGPKEHLTDDVNDEEADARYARIHEQCAILKFGTDGAWALIVGDADKCAFKDWVMKSHKKHLPAVTLGAAHHGSITFFKDKPEDEEAYVDALNAIDPTYVTVSAPTKAESPHGHPDDDAMELYEEHCGEDNVFHTGDERYTFIFDIYRDGTNSEMQNDTGELAEIYGLESEDDDGDDNPSAKASVSGPFAGAAKEQTGEYEPKKYG